jgi:uncharacterized surface protein with fasciclin (FAS1) repeats
MNNGETMKFGKRLCYAVIAMAALMQIANAQSRDLIDTALATQKFNLFLSLVRDADLTFQLKGSGPFTIYAPTDTAINAKYTKSQLDALRANPARLREILLHHVVSGRVDAVSTVKMKVLHPMAGAPILTGIVGGHGSVGGAHFVITNVNTSNGVLHGIDEVLTP